MRVVFTCLALCFCLFTPAFSLAQTVFLPEPLPSKQDIAELEKTISRETGFNGIRMYVTMVVNWREDEFVVLFGFLSGKPNMRSIYHLENDLAGISCSGSGIKNRESRIGEITNECMLNGESLGDQIVAVKNYGRLSGKEIFELDWQGRTIRVAQIWSPWKIPKYQGVMALLQ